ncbi:MAG: preprotein translocase subunit SecY [Candidatus Wildermuthbacteria bacterium RIFCSPHIGHO2_12_FULL_45_9]|uniref:Protein translocase subunit SecY n=1 Tax=Candidatus Wildermuthbacteria bacterium RIFCSPHIGHO2_02_FULL_45_25 TaxID=1802450 RepID=A0A1G2R736_9BACT|nr:MAG: preprotein translocase subunit SecY [Candidatus Wildermuthbacteria bacterium RIFCSPHIGHO2_01_FULL_45_20]OHA67901.1 MAG: preprotein translocase subunit SecY [Candidatus Wildermuthbacteria bacterium RIFCSPHIGHO2_02_FULL_45_25]OHA70565.1 MAG: preprotein translocase subunit SecY [Candidatus Wildermuthbacteria bacterium RIFCSPHIGHO2_12_FULL_45_9]
MWLQRIFQIFKLHDLRNRILFVLGVFLVYRLMANVVINVNVLQDNAGGNAFLELVSLFTGGERFSIVMLGLGPYITATIIMQLLTMIFPQLEKMYKEEGDAGRQKFNQYGRILTVPFALLQGYAFLTLFTRQGIISPMDPLGMVTTLATITAGTVLLMWLGELITEKGIGNGVSLLIFAGIVADFPANIWQLYTNTQGGTGDELLNLGKFLALAVAIIASVVFVTQARRNIAVSYAKRVRGNKVFGGVSTYLPLNLNPAGVIPIIFALSLMTFPTMVGSFFQNASGVAGDVARKIIQSLDPTAWLYLVIYFVLVAAFTYFYTAVTFDPKSIATNLQKMGGFIPGVRPGQSTAHFISYILNRILFIGAFFLGFIAVMPFLVQKVTAIQAFSFLVGGTALLIIVNVVLETMRQLRAQLEMRDYDKF